MEGFGNFAAQLASVVTAIAAVFGLFFLARQNGLLRQQLARPDPIVSVEAFKIRAWNDDAWRRLTVTVYNQANIPMHVSGVEVIANADASLWRCVAVQVSDRGGGSHLAAAPPTDGGLQKLPLGFKVERADTAGKPGPRRMFFHCLIRVGKPGQPLPKVRLTYRWKTNNATTMATVAIIWDTDAAT